MHLREARAIQTDEQNHRLGTLAHILIAANSDPEKRSDVPPWHEIFNPISIRYRSALADFSTTATSIAASAVPPQVTGKLFDGFTLSQKEAAKKKPRGRRTRKH